MASQDRIPEKLGPYRLQDRLGEGGMGAVYLSPDRERRPVAIKVLHSRVAAAPTARPRLGRAGGGALPAAVAHTCPYMVPRSGPGRTLADTVREQGPLAPPALERLAGG